MIYIVYITLIALSLCSLLSIVVVEVFILSFIQEQYDNWKRKKFRQEWEMNFEKILQQQYKEELHRKEQEKYPLFYWRELTNGNR